VKIFSVNRIELLLEILDPFYVETTENVSHPRKAPNDQYMAVAVSYLAEYEGWEDVERHVLSSLCLSFTLSAVCLHPEKRASV
jgi:hypothetical protein